MAAKRGETSKRSLNPFVPSSFFFRVVVVVAVIGVVAAVLLVLFKFAPTKPTSTCSYISPSLSRKALSYIKSAPIM